MDASIFLALALACAPQVHAGTTRALVSVESAFNPWAIGVIGGALVRQPRARAEALATARALRDAGWNDSISAGTFIRGAARSRGVSLPQEPITIRFPKPPNYFPTKYFPFSEIPLEFRGEFCVAGEVPRDFATCGPKNPKSLGKIKFSGIFCPARGRVAV